MLHSIPSLALVFLNLIVIYFVVRERERTHSGMFLLVNAVSLILWAAGMELWRGVNGAASPLFLTGLSTLLIGANLLHFAATRPTPITPIWRHKWVMLGVVFIPCAIFAFLWDYRSASPLRSSSISPFLYNSWESFWQSEGRIPFIVLSLLLIASTFLLAIRYNVASHGPDRNLPRHLLLAVVVPAMFMMLFGVVSSSGRIPLIPSPSLAMALIAQLSILVVIRQEEVERPLYLSRWILYTITVLVGFFIAHLLFTFYESLTAERLLAPTVRATILVTIIVLVITGSIPRVQTLFDRLMFRRAWEYRKLVRDAQKELTETRKRLREAERLSLVGEMAARIAHEIKNPLGPIRGYAQMMHERIELMEDFPQRATFLRQLSIITEEVENIDVKVRHLLDIARQPDLSANRENINQVVQRAAILLRLEADTLSREQGESGESISIVEDLASNLPEVYCNRTRMEEALFNVCRNAFEAAGPGGEIVLRTSKTASPDGREGVAITIEDDGPGFSETARQHLFEPFYTEKMTGTGLGLSIVKSHIDLHKGSITFGERKGGGTSASIWIPLDPRTRTSDKQGSEETAGARQLAPGPVEQPS